MRSSGAAQFLHGRGKSSRIEEECIDSVCHREGVFHRFRTFHMHHLHERDARQCFPEALVYGRIEMVAELERVCSASALLFDDALRTDFAGEQESSDRRGNGRGDGRDLRFGDDTRSARHGGHESDGGRSAGDGGPGFVGGLNAANFDANAHVPGNVSMKRRIGDIPLGEGRERISRFQKAETDTLSGMEFMGKLGAWVDPARAFVHSRERRTPHNCLAGNVHRVTRKSKIEPIAL